MIVDYLVVEDCRIGRELNRLMQSRTIVFTLRKDVYCLTWRWPVASDITGQLHIFVYEIKALIRTVKYRVVRQFFQKLNSFTTGLVV